MPTPTHPDLVYAQIGERQLALDLYLPENGQPPYPLIVWIHGGAWWAGSKADCTDALALLPEGYAVASVDYRLSQEAIFPAQIQDVRAAVRWLRLNASEYGVDPERFAAWGSSAGGHLAALLGASWEYRGWDASQSYTQSAPDMISCVVQGVIDWYGPSDFNHMNNIPGDQDHFAADSPESQLIGGAVPLHPELVQAANPITYLSQPYPPFLICHGSSDRLVLPNQSQMLYEALTRRGYEVTLRILPGQGHGFQGRLYNLALEDARGFLAQIFKSVNFDNQD